jgi:hypothetical protein
MPLWRPCAIGWPSSLPSSARTGSRRTTLVSLRDRLVQQPFVILGRCLPTRKTASRPRPNRFAMMWPDRLMPFTANLHLDRSEPGNCQPVSRVLWTLGDSLEAANQNQDCFCGGSHRGIGSFSFERCRMGSDIAFDHWAAGSEGIDASRQPDVRRRRVADRVHGIALE